MLRNEECQGTGTVEGLEVCVLGEPQTTQKGTFQVAMRHAEQAVEDQDRGTTNHVSSQAPCHLQLSLTNGSDIQQKPGKEQVHLIVRRQAPPRAAAQPDGWHGELVFWMS